MLCNFLSFYLFTHSPPTSPSGRTHTPCLVSNYNMHYFYLILYVKLWNLRSADASNNNYSFSFWYSFLNRHLSSYFNFFISIYILKIVKYVILWEIRKLRGQTMCCIVRDSFQLYYLLFLSMGLPTLKSYLGLDAPCVKENARWQVIAWTTRELTFLSGVEHTNVCLCVYVCVYAHVCMYSCACACFCVCVCVCTMTSRCLENKGAHILIWS